MPLITPYYEHPFSISECHTGTPPLIHVCYPLPYFGLKVEPLCQWDDRLIIAAVLPSSCHVNVIPNLSTGKCIPQLQHIGVCYRLSIAHSHLEALVSHMFHLQSHSPHQQVTVLTQLHTTHEVVKATTIDTHLINLHLSHIYAHYLILIEHIDHLWL